MEKIKVAIFGMGNLGNACKQIIEERHDEFELIQTFNRQNADTVDEYKDKVDVMLLCVGSAVDAPIIAPNLARDFSTVDSFDTHAKLFDYMESIKRSQGKSRVSIVGAGWDPGLMSVMRLYFRSALPNAMHESYWGVGVSLGHTNVLKKVNGIIDAIQFTIPNKKTMNKTRKGESVCSNKKHIRHCYIVADKAEHKRIEREIKGIPNYFAPYKTIVKFVSIDEFNKKYKNRREHAGCVITSSGDINIEFNVSMLSNPHFTASAMIANTVACYNIQKEGQSGVFTVADIAPKYLFRKDILGLI
ncbi:MAG: diaminopimelate dehydrogenase [Firmicutes bacterium]|nr:diaminopimelate dehydrogenase [Bacillota bacterium]